MTLDGNADSETPAQIARDTGKFESLSATQSEHGWLALHTLTVHTSAIFVASTTPILC